MLALVAEVVLADQAVKWWAWRHVPQVKVNTGGDILVGQTIGAWFADPVTGSLLDVLDLALLSAAIAVLALSRMPRIVSVPGTVMIAGWCSNLLDRLGLHHWTAPGSAHGVVDFLGIGAHYYNVADLCIIGGTPLFLLAAGYLGVRAILRPAVRSVPLAVRSVPLAGRSLAPADRGAPLTGQGLALDRGGVQAYGSPSAYLNAGPRQPDGGRLARPLTQPDQA